MIYSTNGAKLASITATRGEGALEGEGEVAIRYDGKMLAIEVGSGVIVHTNEFSNI